MRNKKEELLKIDSNKERVYRILNEFNSGCNNCSLSRKPAVGGHLFSPIQNIELLIVAAYPAMEEIKKGYSLAPNEKKEKIDKLNAGRYLQYSIWYHFDFDDLFPSELKPFYNNVGFTNMIKCCPFTRTGDKLDVKDNHIKACKETWLEKEIKEIDKYNPTCPILLCGSEAVKLLHSKQKVYSSRRKIHYYQQHPIVCTFNPVEAVRYTSYEIVDKKINSKNKLSVESTRPEKPIIFGSTTWHWKNDMELIKKLVIENYTNKLNAQDK